MFSLKNLVIKIWQSQLFCVKSPTCQKPIATWNNNDLNLSLTYLQKIAVVCQTIHGQLHIPIISLCQLYVTPQIAREFIEIVILLSQSHTQCLGYAKHLQLLWTDTEFSCYVPDVKIHFLLKWSTFKDRPIVQSINSEVNWLHMFLLNPSVSVNWIYFKIILFNSVILGEKQHYPWCTTVKKIPPFRESQRTNHAKQAL